ncbi:unnamed protein product [Ectocarpus sp. CCAP 1310/34]|nr:unnamed protein product [Ectocarpus sp. CCAP 1310/34]
MPVGQGVGGQDGSAATLVRSDQDSGMALVKSKDGRTKWLTVSTDPTSTPPSTTWDERVRTWASMLGVCAPPPSPPSSKRHNHGTPLPTPPPDSPAWGGEERGGRHQDKQQQRQQQDHWPSDREDDSSAATPAAAAAVADDSTAATGTSSPASAAAASPRVGVAASTARRKPVATGKRVGSFARGFLLGLGGGGSGSGGGGGGGSGGGSGGGASKRSKNPTGNAPAHAAGKGSGAVVAPASTLPPQTREAGEASILQDERDGGDDMAVVPSTPVETMAVAGADGVTGGRRQRWVKGAPPSPSDSDASDSDGDVTCLDNRGRGEGASPCGTCSPPAAAVVAAAAPAPAPAPAGGDAEGMEWLETGPGGNVAAKANSGGTKTIGGGGSKKKKKNKGKGKGGGGGGGGGAKPTKNASSSLPSVAAENKTASTQPMLQSSSGQQEPCRTLNGAAAGRIKAKRAKGGKKLSVSFGRVNLVEFTRDVGGCGVPSDGTWGLALGLPFRETVVDVDGYEASRTEILEERTSELSRKQRHLSTGETRQFDYRPVGEKNPLFYRLGEKERRHVSVKILLDYACFHKSDLEEADRDNEAVQTPDDSAGASDNNSHIDGSGGKSTSDFDAYSHKVSHADFVDKSQEASVELTALRDSRQNSQGCSCSHVRPDKLNLAKLRAELTKRRVGLKASGSKKDLVKVLQEAMRQDEEKNGGKALKVCRSEECQCVQDGVECHADLCSCCKGPSIGEKDAHHGGNCGNPEGVYAYSSSVVRSHRGPYVTSKVVPGKERGGGHGRSDSVCSDHH